MGNAIRLMRSVTGSAAAIRSHTGRFFENATPRSGVSRLTTSGMMGMPLGGYGCARNASMACDCATTAAACAACMSAAAFSSFGHAAFAWSKVTSAKSRGSAPPLPFRRSVSGLPAARA